MSAIPLIASTSGTAPASLLAGTTAWGHLASCCQPADRLSESLVQVKWRSPGTLSLLTVVVESNDRGASSVKVRKNGADGNQVVSIGASATGTFQDATHTDTVAAADLLTYQTTAGSGGTTLIIRTYCCAFAATTNDRVRYATSYDSSNVGDANNKPIAGASIGWIASGSVAISKLRVRAGTFRNAAVYTQSNNRNGASTITLYQNGSATALSVSITASTTGQFEDTSNTVTTTAGDLVNWIAALGGSTGAISNHHLSVDFETTDPAYADLLAFGQPTGVSAGTTHYFTPAGLLIGTLATAEAATLAPVVAAATATGLDTYVTSNSSSAAATMTLRKNGANTTITLSIGAGLTGHFSATSSTAAYAANDTISAAIVVASGSGSVAFTTVSTSIRGVALSITGATVFGTKGTVLSSRTFLANLDDTTRSINLPGTFYIGGDLVVTGAAAIAGALTNAGRPVVSTTGSPSSGALAKFSAAATITNADLTGDVTTSGSLSATIANDAVTNAKLANMATQTIKGRTTAGTGDPEDLTATQATAILNAMVGDSGAGGTKGLAPAPSSGDSAAGKFLKADGTWAVPSGTGVSTTGSPANGNLTKFSGASSITNADLTGDVTTSGGVATTLKTAAKTRAIGITIDGGGAAITTGVKGDISIPYACTITGARLLADQSGSIVIDVWKDTYANYPPTNADSICASAKPTLSSAQKSDDTTLTGWTTSVSAGDTIRFNVDSASTVTRVTLILTVTV